MSRRAPRSGGRFARLLAALALTLVAGATSAGGAVLALDTAPPGPPFPPPEENRAVYDFAGVFSPGTIESVETTIDEIEERTGAEVVVYTQVKPGATTESTEADAIALVDTWGVGRLGFDDGLAIFFNFEENRLNGQVQLYAGPGYREAFLTNEERQAMPCGWRSSASTRRRRRSTPPPSSARARSTPRSG
jgi:uncharacterized membrane protein YgcG